MSTGLPPPSLQEGALNSVFNSLLTEVFLTGIYTVVYFETLYIYLTKKASQQWIIVGVISLLYVVYVVQMSVQWVINKRAFIDNGSTQEAAFIAAVAAPTWGTLIFDVCGLLQAALADGLLIWRCFNIWDGSFRAVAVSSFLLFSETAVFLAVIIIAATEHLQPSPSQAHALNELTAAALFITLATSVLTTLLIAYRIHSVTKQDILRGSRARFKHILEILIQSAAVYSVITAAVAIVTIFPLNNNNFVSLSSAQSFTSDFYAFIAGIAPTIMVARVATPSETSTDISVITHVSGLRFGGQSSVQNVTQYRGDSGTTENGDPHLSQESETLEARKERRRLGA